MPSNPRTNKGVYFELPPALIEALRGIAERNRRTLKTEVIIALERYAAAPDVIGSACGSIAAAGPKPEPKQKGK